MRRHFYLGSTMTDGQWALLAPLLPAAGSTGGRRGRPEKWDRLLVLDTILIDVKKLENGILGLTFVARP